MEESTIMVNQYEESYFHAKKRGMKNKPKVKFCYTIKL